VIRNTPSGVPWLVAVTIAALSPTAPLLAGEPAQPQPVPGVGGAVTPYDIATRDDLLFARLVAPLVKGDVPDWLILGGLGKQVGSWVDQFVSAHQVANVITEAFPVEGQPALRSLDG